MWSMPRSVLRIVAGLIGLCAVGGFVLGFQATPEKGRLPGEQVGDAAAAPLEAPEVTPLADDMPPPPPPEEKKKVEEVKKDEVDPDEAAAPTAPPPPTVAVPTPKAAPTDKLGDLLDGVTPPPQEDPPH